MILPSPDIALEWLIAYGYFIIFPLMIIEGPIITVIAAFVASLGHLNVGIVYIVAIIGDLAGDAICYCIGRWGGRPFIERWGKKFGVTVSRLKQAEDFMENHSGKTLISAKLTHGLGIWVLLGAGATRIPFANFLWYNLLGTIPKSAALVLLGFFFGQAYAQIGAAIDTFSAIMIGIILFILGFIWIVRRQKKQSVP